MLDFCIVKMYFLYITFIHFLKKGGGMERRRAAVVPNNNYTHENIVKFLKELVELKKINLDLKVFNVREHLAVGAI